MDIKNILSKCDHTLLSTAATKAEIFALCDDGIRFGCASVCIPPCYVKDAKEYVGENCPSAQLSVFPTVIIPPLLKRTRRRTPFCAVLTR